MWLSDVFLNSANLICGGTVIPVSPLDFEIPESPLDFEIVRVDCINGDVGRF